MKKIFFANFILLVSTTVYSQTDIVLNTKELPIEREIINKDDLCRTVGGKLSIKYKTKNSNVKIKKLNNSINNDSLDRSLLNLVKHPYMNNQGDLPNSMHEDNYASDVSLLGGPKIDGNLKAKYLLNNAKIGGYYYPGMTPTFVYLNDNTMATIRFGSTNNILLLLNPHNLKVKDQTYFIGRQKKLSKLISLGCRFSLFGSTTGGAYFFADNNQNIVIPVTEFYKEKHGISTKYVCGNATPDIEESGIWRYHLNEKKDSILFLEKFIVTKSNRSDSLPVDEDTCCRCNAYSFSKKAKYEDNKSRVERGITATIPDHTGLLWFTTDKGEVFVFNPNDTQSNYYYTDLNDLSYNLAYHIQQQNAKFPIDANDKELGFSKLVDKIADTINIERSEINRLLSLKKNSKYYRTHIHQFDKNCSTVGCFTINTPHKIQNSFIAEGKYVYIITNQALFKLSFDVKNKKIISHWNDTTITRKTKDEPFNFNNTFCGKYYTNSGIRLPGHVQAGSGTTPTLIRSKNGTDSIEHILFCDNDFPRINFIAIDNKTGMQVSKVPLFHYFGSACENSVIAYNFEAAISNTFGYRFPYKKQSYMPGGLEKLKWNNAVKKWQIDTNWQAINKNFDCKTATPKLSLTDGKLYIYNVPEKDKNKVGGNWQITTIDWETGNTLYNLIPKIKNGNKNNLWGTFTIGAKNSLFIAAKKGFYKIE